MPLKKFRILLSILALGLFFPILCSALDGGADVSVKDLAHALQAVHARILALDYLADPRSKNEPGAGLASGNFGKTLRWKMAHQGEEITNRLLIQCNKDAKALGELLEMVRGAPAVENQAFEPLIQSLKQTQNFSKLHREGSRSEWKTVSVETLSTLNLAPDADRYELLKAWYAANHSSVSATIRLDDLRPNPAIGRLAPARFGTLIGGMNSCPVQLTFDRQQHTIQGAVNLTRADVKVDLENGKITGAVNMAPLDLKFTWTPEMMTMEGGANNSPLKLVIDWKKGTMDGYANHTTIQVNFSLPLGHISGAANNAPLGLSFDSFTGKLTGGMNYQSVGVTLTNLDLSEFLIHFYLFLK